MEGGKCVRGLKVAAPAPQHWLELRLIRADPKDPEFKKYFHESYRLYVKYQTAVHG